ncbi:MAG: hypothetical protein LVS60_09665 [Nodosilinea sp. LVE1205-7]
MTPRQGDWLSRPGSPAASPSHHGSDGQLPVIAQLGKLKELEVATALRSARPRTRQRGTPLVLIIPSYGYSGDI